VGCTTGDMRIVLATLSGDTSACRPPICSIGRTITVTRDTTVVSIFIEKFEAIE